MRYKQLDMFTRNPNCPFVGLYEDNDDKCFSLLERNGYEEISEDHPEFNNWLAEIGGVLFENKIAKPTPTIKLPPFFPTINRGGKGLIADAYESFVGITLNDVISLKKLIVASDIKTILGLPIKTKVVLLAFGKDLLIENVWPNRHGIYKQLLSLGVDLITSINYSVWFSQTHSEHLINIKRNWLTFHEMQSYGLPAIPNIYWYGKKDLSRWADWLNENHQIETVAINLQTLRTKDSWETVDDLKFLVKQIDHEIQFLIDGPSVPERITYIRNILPRVSFTNKFCFSSASNGTMISQVGGNFLRQYKPLSRKYIFRQNSNFYKNLISETNKNYGQTRISRSAFET